MKIQYWNDCDALDILYQQGFKQVLYINANLSEPTYSTIFEDTFDKWQKVYHFDLFVPEYMVDALMTLPLHDNVLIDGHFVHNIDVQPNNHGRWWLVGISFTSEYYVNSGCNNLHLAPNYTSAPPGECFSPDKIIKGIVTTQGTSDGIWLLQTSSGVGYIAGSLYQYINGSASAYPIYEGQGIYDSSTGISYYYNGAVFHQYPYITMIEQVGVASYHIYGFAFPDTFVYLSYRQLGSMDWIEAVPILAATFEGEGLVVNTTVADDYEWKIESKTFSCNYGETTPTTYWTGYILLNDMGDYITQNADNDRLYR